MAKLESAIDAELRGFLERGISATELEGAKKTLAAGAVYARDSLRAAPNILGRALSTGRTIEEVEAWPDRVKAVTVEDVNNAIRAVLSEKRSVTSMLLPGPAS
jgi:zinc protease